LIISQAIDGIFLAETPLTDQVSHKYCPSLPESTSVTFSKAAFCLFIGFQ
jgi:hypothetical protein